MMAAPSVLGLMADPPKTQTRRPIKKQPERMNSGLWYVSHVWGEKTTGWVDLKTQEVRQVLQGLAPYKVGRVYYVKETYYRGWPDGREASGKTPGYTVYYKADEQGHQDPGYSWKSSMFMPARDARLFIRITEVRAQRLREIEYEDVQAERLRFWFTDQQIWDRGNMKRARGGGGVLTFGRKDYVDVWERLYGFDGVNKNPWLYAYTFEAVNPEEIDVNHTGTGNKGP